MFASETYSLEDCLNFDSGTSDNSSKYALTNITSITHSNDGYYTVVSGASSSMSSYYGLVTFKDTTVPTNFKLSGDLKFTHYTSSGDIIHCLQACTSLTSDANTIVGMQCGEYKVSTGLMARPWNDGHNSRANTQLSSDVWYAIEMSYNNGTWSGVVKSNGSTVWSGSVSVSKTINYVGISESGGHNTFYFKNLKLKAL